MDRSYEVYPPCGYGEMAGQLNGLSIVVMIQGFRGYLGHDVAPHRVYAPKQICRRGIYRKPGQSLDE